MLPALTYTRYLYGSIILYSFVAAIGIIQGFDWILLFPAMFFILLLAFFRLEQLILLTVFLTPLSLNLSETSWGFGISLPAEPLIFGLMLITFIKIIYDGGLDKKLLYYPVSILILLHLFWFIFTTISSSIFLVSVKYTLARIWFIMAFYYLAALMFRDMKNIYRFVWYYTIPLLIVVIYSTFRHAAAGFTEQAAHISMTPFYNDHTAYAAALAMFLPVIISFIFLPAKKPWFRILSVITSSILIAAIVLSYTRASWVGLAAAFVCLFVFLLRINTKIVLAGIIGFLIVLAFSWTQFMIRLESNRKQSSTEYAAHLQSISNISTDASNVERINRWSSAVRMFYERPVLGWGPGTYQFQYAPFQREDEKTVISTNAGNRGNSHSEYIGPLAEQGVYGMLGFMLIIIFVVVRASRIIRYNPDRSVRILATGLLLGLITYWIHGLLNYFLDTDKASVPFWGFIAALTALDIYHTNRKVNSSVAD